MASIVFHLMASRSGRLAADVVLRYPFDPRCHIDEDDIWQRTDTNGLVTLHRVTEMRIFLGVNDEELHVFTVPHLALEAR